VSTKNKVVILSIVKKKLNILLFLFPLFIMGLAGYDLFAQVTADSTFSASTIYSPKAVGMDPETLSGIDVIVKNSIKARALPGCQVLIIKDGKTIYDKCFGNYTYEPVQKVTPATLYDLASLSKTTGTLLAIMKLYDEGKLHLTDSVAMHLPFLRGTDKGGITIQELLFHESGLPASLSGDGLIVEKKQSCPDSTQEMAQTVQMGCATHQYKKGWTSRVPSAEYTLQVSDSFYLHHSFHDSAMQKIAHFRLRSKTYLYSCVNFILLKEMAETISGMPMDVFLDSVFFKPMGLQHTTYRPLQKHQKEEIAPTLKKDYLRNGVIQGYVHDPDAAFLGGVSGNAGLFASARDVATIYQMLLNHGELNEKRYLSEKTCCIFTTTLSASGRRALGFDKPTPFAPAKSPCCISAPHEVYGHTGYTGTCCWVDPVNHLIYVFLSNRTYPSDGINKLAKMGIRTKIQEVIYQSLK
jgi:CubicO group peptidase (beta-lactamase class C family)